MATAAIVGTGSTVMITFPIRYGVGAVLEQLFASVSDTHVIRYVALFDPVLVRLAAGIVIAVTILVGTVHAYVDEAPLPDVSAILKTPVNGAVPVICTFTVELEPLHICGFAEPNILPVNGALKVRVTSSASGAHGGLVMVHLSTYTPGAAALNVAFGAFTLENWDVDVLGPL